MKNIKRITAPLAAIFAAATVFMFAACSDHGAPDYSVDDPQFVTELSEFERDYTDKLERFMDGRENRTTYSDNEESAAKFLQEELSAYGYTGASIYDFDVKLSDKKTVSSRNVVATYAVADGKRTDSTKNVVIATDYDNRFDAPYEGLSGTRSPGVLYNGTSVAASLYIADYLMQSKPELDFDVTFVFFGGTTANSDGYPEGSYKFLTNLLKSEKHNNTVLLVELRRIGVDHVYAFSDVRKTKRETFFDGIARENSLNVYKPTQKSPSLPVTTLDGVPFSQWVQGGHSVAFFNSGIPTLDITGGNYETINMTDAESSEFGNICGTEDDTLANLKRMYPDYAEKAATAVSLVVKGILDADFIAAVEYDRDSFPNTSVLTKSWIWYLVVLGIVAIAYGAVCLARMRIDKKYPVAVARPKNVKMAVFGMDYEDRDENSIYIDIRPSNSVDNEIFPGIPNNGTSKPNVAPPVFGDLINNNANTPNSTDEREKVETNARESSDDSIDRQSSSDEIPQSAPPDPSEVDSEQSAEPSPSAADSKDPTEKTDADNKDDKAGQAETAAKPSPRKRTSAPTAGKSAAARKTTSAPKSSAAKKSASGSKKSDGGETPKDPS